MTRRRVVVSGRVQGVCFRDTCQREAQERGVAGWIRNQPDGSVEAVFEGDESAVEELVDWCRAGPLGAKVKHVAVTDEQPQGEPGFEVRL